MKINPVVIIFLVIAAIVTVIALQGPEQPPTADNSQPEITQTITEYGQMCAEMIGEIPAFDCNDGTIVPVTVNGEVPEEYVPRMSCDKPSMLPYGEDTFGQCTPYSKVLDLSHGTTQIAAFCRREQLRDIDSVYYDEVDIILHDVTDGDTCWFHAENKKGHTNGFDSSRVPPPNEVTPPPGKVSATDFWWSPKQTATKDCGGCHDADPFMYSPYIGQVWDKVPTDPFGWYRNIGPDFQSWKQSHAIHTEDNTCLGCHRIGNLQSCETVAFPDQCEGEACTTINVIRSAAGMDKVYEGSEAAHSFPLSHWMPVDNFHSELFWNEVYLKSVTDLLTCCNDPENAICSFEPITGLPKS